MIFIGNGSHLKNALKYTFEKGYKIDYVLSSTDEFKAWCNSCEIPFKKIININDEVKTFVKYCPDKIIFSINNGQLFKKEMLDLEGFRFYNIHNGIVPSYRGMPEICIIFAILNNEKEFGVSLHEIDEGIDTGRCIDIHKFKINEFDTFQSIMLKSIECCNVIFYNNLEKIVHRTFTYLTDMDSGNSKLYTYKDLSALKKYKNHSNLTRATKFGIFSLWYKKAYNYIQNEVMNGN